MYYNHRPPLSRQNSLKSAPSANSRQNSFRLSRQNSINSQHTLSPQNSLGSSPRGEEYKQNNLSLDTQTPDSKVAVEIDKPPDDDDDDDDSDDGLPVSHVQ